MKRTIFCGLVAVAMAVMLSDASACPCKAKANAKSDGAKTAATDTKTAKTVAAKVGKKGCCGKKAKTVAAKTAAAKSGKKGCCGKKAKTVADKGGCPVAAKTKAVLASMPAIEYRVGDEVTECSKHAAGLVEKTGKPLEYVIGDETFKTEGEALVRLTALLDKTAAEMQSVQYVAGGKCGHCPVTAKNIAKASGTKITYRVGGVDFEKKADAEKVAKLVADAAKEVTMTYKVNGKTFHCDKKAGDACKKFGKKMTYVIGDQETDCATSAKLIQARAKVRKIVETASAASFSL